MQCVQDKEEILYKNAMGLIVATLGFAICLVFRIRLNFIY